MDEASNRLPADPVIPLVRPALPTLEELTPLLTQIWTNEWVTNTGPIAVAFETSLKELLPGFDVALTSTGTSALDLGLAALELEEGSEVVTPAFTFPASGPAIRRNGLRPVWCDIEPDSLTLDPEAVRASVGPATSAILPVHVFGHPADVVSLEEIAGSAGLALFYDAAGAFGVSFDGNVLAGFGDAAAYSFHATKVMCSIEGGAVVSGSSELVERVRRLRNFGISPPAAPKPRGTNAKLSELHAAVGFLNLQRVSDYIAARRHRSHLYSELLGDVDGVRFVTPRPGTDYNHAYVTIQVHREDEGVAAELHRFLSERGITAKRYFDDTLLPDDVDLKALPVTDAARASTLCLPLWPAMPESAVTRVCETISRFVAETPGRQNRARTNER